MRRPLFSFLSVLFVVTFIANFCWAQTAVTATPATVPPLIKVSGTLANAQGTVGVTFALYAEQTGGAPLWLETQNVTRMRTAATPSIWAPITPTACR